MTSPTGLILVAALSLPIASCSTGVMKVARMVAKFSDDVGKGTRRVAPRALKQTDDAICATARATQRVSRGVWNRFSSSVDKAVAASSRVDGALLLASARMSPRAFRLLRQKYEKNKAAMQSEINRANSGYRSDAECAEATLRIEKLAREQAAIEKVIVEWAEATR